MDDTIRIEIQIPQKSAEPVTPEVPNIIHVIQPVIKKIEPKSEPILKDTTGEIVQKDEPGTLEKVRRHGSRLEKAAVNATQKFSYRGITVKDSRAS